MLGTFLVYLVNVKIVISQSSKLEIFYNTISTTVFLRR